MPISEDEFEFKSNQEPQSTMSKAELRKTHKPIMEKRRRARINHCLNEIKTLILEAMNKDPARHSKLEKADILEMAVKHLQNVQRQQLSIAIASDPSVLRKFKNGFNECAGEIDKYITQIDGIDNGMKQRISSHLQKCLNGIDQVAQFNNFLPGFGSIPFIGNTVFNANINQIPESSNNNSTTNNNNIVGDQNNNPRIQIPQGIQLIPSRLPSGELALLVPNSSNLPYLPGLSNRPSAFSAVISSSNARLENRLSPPVSPNSTSNLCNKEDKIRSDSPKGFRPVIPSNKIVEDRAFQPPQLEVKTIKFPIHTNPKSPKKIEPLCIITNQSERYKQAQIKEDSVHFEENQVPRGVKRKLEAPGPGLLQEYYQPSKIAKLPEPTNLNLREEQRFREKSREDEASTSSSSLNTSNTSNESGSSSSDNMWRPW